MKMNKKNEMKISFRNAKYLFSHVVSYHRTISLYIRGIHKEREVVGIFDDH